MSTGASFFADPKTSNAVATLASADTLTIFVGAGVPVECGLPPWATLVRKLLVRAAGELGGASLRAEGRAREFADWTLEVDGVLGGAAIARAAKQQDASIRKVLYERTGPLPQPGPSARAIASLLVSTPGVEVATTNYDDVLSLAAMEAGASAVHRLIDGSAAPDDGGVSVRHLHGLLTPSVKAGTIVLAEGDYFAMGDAAWQAEWCVGRLTSGPCLFVGMSMSDPNLLRYLYRAGKQKHEHVAVLTRQGDAWLSRRSETVSPDVAQARESGALRRWTDLGVSVLQPEYYSDSAQLLHEVLAHRLPGGAEAYRDRLARWDADIADSLVFSSDLARFRDQQDWLQEELEGLVETVRGHLAASVDVGDERFQIALWVRQPGDRIVLLAASDRAHRDPNTLEPVDILGASEWVAVRAFRQGSTLLEDTSAHKTSRWNSVMGIPIEVQTPVYGRLQVGVVTLAGTEPRDRSALSHAAPEPLLDVRNAVVEHASALLTPP